MQQKVAFLINGIVLGVHDVPDGASQTTLDAHKAELAKTGSVAAEVGFSWDFKIDHIVHLSIVMDYQYFVYF